MRRLFLLFVLSAAGACAAPIEADLGQGLRYFRSTALPADLPADAAIKASVLDLRYATGDEAAAQALAAWLKFHASARTPVFVLANAATAAPLLRVLPAGALPAGVVTLGLPGAGFAPDIAISTTTEAERLAYEALAKGTAASSLIQQNAGKARHDEAEMVKRQADGEPFVDPEAMEEALADGVAAAAKPTPPAAPLFDAALQRAVQLHRGLAVFKRWRG